MSRCNSFLNKPGMPGSTHNLPLIRTMGCFLVKGVERAVVLGLFVLTTQVSSPTKRGSTRSPVGNNAMRLVAVRCSSFCCLTHGLSLVISVKR